MWRCVVFWKISSTFMRGSVAFRPLLLSSSVWVMAAFGCGGAARQEAAPLESPHHIEVGARRAARPRRHALNIRPCTLCLSRSVRRAARRAAPLGGCQSLQTLATTSSASSRPTRSRWCRATSSPASRSRCVKPGMTRAQVRDVLGSPLLADVVPRRPLGLRVHDPAPGRRAAAAPRRSCCSTATCSTSIEGGADLPSEREFVASIDTVKAARNVPPAGADRRADQGACRCRPRPPAAGPPADRPAPARSYPPLEPRS